MIQTFENISLKSNILLQSPAKTIYLNPSSYCQLKALDIKEESDQKLDGIDIDFGNFGNGLTNVSLDGYNTQKSTFNIYTCIPSGNFGLMMFYKSNIDPIPVILISADEGKLTKYNTDETVISLATGLTIIKIPSECSKIKIEAKAGKSTLIFSNLDIIPENDPLNPKLG